MIHDGFNLEGVIYDDPWTLRFVYRPMLAPERRQFYGAYEGWEQPEKLKLMCQWLSRHIIAMSVDMTLEDIWCGNPYVFKRLMQVVTGVASPDNDIGWTKGWEWDDAENMKRGVRLSIEHPHLERRSCASCQKWWFDEETQKPFEANGLPILRPPEAGLMCQTRDGCPVGTPEKQFRLSPRNRMAFDHFRLCEATGNFPDDPIVARNALVIRDALNHGRITRPNARRGPQTVARTRSASRSSPDEEFFLPFGLACG